MNVDKELLQKYVSGRCSQEECKMVEYWLSSEEEVEYEWPLFDEDMLKRELRSRIRIGKGHGVTTFSSVKKIIRYVSAACIALAVGLYGIYLFTDYRTGIGTNEQLQITSGSGVTWVEGDHCILDFSGYLQLVNTSGKIKMVTCPSGKTFQLDPGETYYLETIKGDHYLIKEKHLSPEDQFIRFVRGDVSVVCEKV